jgi:hypothetical protein
VLLLLPGLLLLLLLLLQVGAPVWRLQRPV